MPGDIGTGQLSQPFQRRGEERIVHSAALRSIGTPEDCARVVGALAGPNSDYITGAVIPIDGEAVRYRIVYLDGHATEL